VPTETVVLGPTAERNFAASCSGVAMPAVGVEFSPAASFAGRLACAAELSFEL